MKHARNSGFTLIEVMVAILLMAIVSLVAWRGLDSVSRADLHVRDSTEQTRALLRVFGQLERDLDQRATTELNEPVLPGHDPASSTPTPAFSVKGSDQHGVQLEIIRSTVEGTALQRVRWWQEGDTLYRASGSARARFPLPAPKGKVAVLQGVSEFAIRLWQPGKGWRSLDGQRQDNPAGFELRLSRDGPQGVERYRQVLGPFN
ncbi:PulJ/GspJ family protein [Pseudomonas fontis]|uniref:Type II secretion system protein J n=1 Tax=Pseudomonas fontis TaxID=2942633 RepID=A0ABT5NPU0_9PSED|nr:prepilin-type N-terminal cleavage/methylation domain-containing protein [Pseudomonas fontis]MDD0974704.1 prepilin-type N-terminal cleavage/methylation domain-containing protein [Pseudomonas fontis]MDD0990199.1 prepilin-type N-terminal cleavage/methylation domain-containing protein [Pseudomonas fontis]